MVLRLRSERETVGRASHTLTHSSLVLRVAMLTSGASPYLGGIVINTLLLACVRRGETVREERAFICLFRHRMERSRDLERDLHFGFYGWEGKERKHAHFERLITVTIDTQLQLIRRRRRRRIRSRWKRKKQTQRECENT
jgi:hypothetical protein